MEHAIAEPRQWRSLQRFLGRRETRVGRQWLYQLEAAALYEVQQWLGPFGRFWREKLVCLRDLLDTTDDDQP